MLGQCHPLPTGRGTRLLQVYLHICQEPPPSWPALSSFPDIPYHSRLWSFLVDKWQWYSLFKNCFNKLPINKREEEAMGLYLIVLKIKLKGEGNFFPLHFSKSPGIMLSHARWQYSEPNPPKTKSI